MLVLLPMLSVEDEYNLVRIDGSEINVLLLPEFDDFEVPELHGTL